MKISVLCTDRDHPVYPFLENWCNKFRSGHEVELVNDKHLLTGGDILFLISCNDIVGQDVRSMYGKSLVIHASDLPKGRGWSPHVWQIIEGNKDITVSMIEAEDKVDSGAIWDQKTLHLEGHELCPEINEKLFSVELELMTFAVKNFASIKPQVQKDLPATYYRKRIPEDSRIDPEKTIAQQFDLLRVADPDRYPAFFDFRGHRYKISISKVEKI